MRNVLVYEERDPGFFIGVGRTSSRKWIVIGAGNQETSEAWLIPASDPTAAPQVVEPRREGVRYSIGRWDGRWTIRTNDDGAVDFKLMTSEAAMPARASWSDFIGHQPGRLIAGVAAYKGHLVRLERLVAHC